MVKKLIIFLLCFVSIERLCRLATDGFTVTKISSDHAYDERFETKPAAPEVLALLDQPFYFLGSGAQFYAFESQDRTTVVKFLKHSRRRPRSFLNKLHLFGPLEKWRQETITARAKRLEELLTSCKIAESLLKDETGLLYAHLNKTTGLQKTLRITDKIGIEHLIDLDRTEFVVQQKACPLTASQALAAEKQLAASLLDKHVVHLDDHPKRNIGLLHEKPIYIDIGSFQHVD